MKPIKVRPPGFDGFSTNMAAIIKYGAYHAHGQELGEWRGQFATGIYFTVQIKQALVEPSELFAHKIFRIKSMDDPQTTKRFIDQRKQVPAYRLCIG